MKKMLMLASVASMIDQFNMHNIKLLKDLGFEVHVAANFEDGNTSSSDRINKFKNELSDYGISYYQIDFSRDITNIFSNVKAYYQVKNIIKRNKYKFIHAHSPIGGVVGRIAGHQTKTPVIYTAHGFHFYDGAPIKNWLIYYPVEKWLAKYTDVLITINRDDYINAKKLKAKNIVYIPGIGLDSKKFKNVIINKTKKRLEMGIPENSIVLLSVGELNENKNHETIIKAVKKLNNPNIYYMICGQGDKEADLKELSSNLGIQDKIKFLGFRDDIAGLYKISDVFVFPSFREGLSVALMEALASGLPCVVSKIRGNVDLIEEGKGGYLVKPDDIDGFVNSLSKLIINSEIRDRYSNYNVKKILRFDKGVVGGKIKGIYSQF